MLLCLFALHEVMNRRPPHDKRISQLWRWKTRLLPGFSPPGINKTMNYTITIFSVMFLYSCVLLFISISLMGIISLDENLHESTVFRGRRAFTLGSSSISCSSHETWYEGCLLQAFVTFSCACCKMSALAVWPSVSQCSTTPDQEGADGAPLLGHAPQFIFPGPAVKPTPWPRTSSPTQPLCLSVHEVLMNLVGIKFATFHPLVNPIIYRFKLHKIRHRIATYVSRKRGVNKHFQCIFVWLHFVLPNV